MTEGRVAIAVRGGYFVYNVASAKLTSFTALAYTTDPNQRLKSISFARNGAALGVFRGSDIEPFVMPIVFYGPVEAPMRISSTAQEPYAFELAQLGDRYSLNTIGVRRFDGTLLYEVPTIGFASQGTPPPLLSPGGNNVVQRGECNRECTARIYHDGALSGTLDARALGWLDNDTIVARKIELDNNQVRGYALDGSRRFGTAGCALNGTGSSDPTLYLGLGYPVVQTLSATEIYMPTDGARCDLSNSALTPVARYRDVLPRELTGNLGIYLLDGGRSVALAPY